MLTPQCEVQTDPRELDNMLTLRPAAGFAGRKEFVLGGSVIGEQTTGLDPLVNAVVGALLEHPLDSFIAGVEEFKGGVAAASKSDGISKLNTSKVSKIRQTLNDFNTLRKRPSEKKESEGSDCCVGKFCALRVYKARPLNGIWATAPYLHNGSVPNLYELLLPQEQRSKTFYVGNREFDPVNVGQVADRPSPDGNTFTFDTTLLGNDNGGHEYGANELNREQRMQIVEYMKTL